MTNTNTFAKAFSSEQYKLSKNKEIFGILLLPVLIIFAIDLYIAYDVISSGTDPGGGTSNPWKMVLGRTVFMFFYLLFPILLFLLPTLLNRRIPSQTQVNNRVLSTFLFDEQIKT